MVGRVLRFVRLPFLLLLLVTAVRFYMGAAGVAWNPRTNSVSIIVVMFVSALYFGALSKKVGGFGWGGTVLTGYSIGLFTQILIFTATWLSYAMNIEGSYFRNWDALNVPPGTIVPMAKAMQTRAGALVVGPVIAIVPALLGRLLSALAPEPRG